MNEGGVIIGIAVIVVALIALGWWLLIESEGVYLGRRMVIWLYDRYAGRYDDIKNFNAGYDHLFLAQPLMDRIQPNKAPLVLDAATGTGRLPLALTKHTHFAGRIVGLDLSSWMLSLAALKLKDEPKAVWVWGTLETLPFPDDTFDVVTCLEALEFMMEPDRGLAELVRVLKPGGVLLTTNRLTGRWMPGKTWSEARLRDLLAANGVVAVEFLTWQVDYVQVWGTKAAREVVDSVNLHDAEPAQPPHEM